MPQPSKTSTPESSSHFDDKSDRGKYSSSKSSQSSTDKSSSSKSHSSSSSSKRTASEAAKGYKSSPKSSTDKSSSSKGKEPATDRDSSNSPGQSGPKKKTTAKKLSSDKPGSNSKTASRSGTDKDGSYSWVERSTPASGTPASETVFYAQTALAIAEEGPVSFSLYRTPKKEKPASGETASVKDHKILSEKFKNIHKFSDNDVRDHPTMCKALKELYGHDGFLITGEKLDSNLLFIHVSKAEPFDLLSHLRLMSDGGVWCICPFTHVIPKHEIRSECDMVAALLAIYGPGRCFLKDAGTTIVANVTSRDLVNLLGELRSMANGGLWQPHDLINLPRS